MNIQQGQNTSSWDNQNKCLWRLHMAFPRSTRCNVSCIVFQHLTLQRFQISHKWPSYSIICLNIQFIISLGFPSTFRDSGVRFCFARTVWQQPTGYLFLWKAVIMPTSCNLLFFFLNVFHNLDGLILLLNYMN